MTDTITSRQVNGAEYPAVGSYVLDGSHTHPGFAVRHMAVAKVRGSFTECSGTLELAEDPSDSTAWSRIRMEAIASASAPLRPSIGMTSVSRSTA